ELEHYNAVIHSRRNLIEVIGPDFFALYGLQDFLSRLGVVPKTGLQRSGLLAFYFVLARINVKGASLGKLFYPSSPVSVLWSCHKGMDFWFFPVIFLSPSIKGPPSASEYHTNSLHRYLSRS